MDKDPYINVIKAIKEFSHTLVISSYSYSSLLLFLKFFISFLSNHAKNLYTIYTKKINDSINIYVCMYKHKHPSMVIYRLWLLWVLVLVSGSVVVAAGAIVVGF